MMLSFSSGDHVLCGYGCCQAYVLDRVILHILQTRTLKYVMRWQVAARLEDEKSICNEDIPTWEDMLRVLRSLVGKALQVSPVPRYWQNISVKSSGPLA